MMEAPIAFVKGKVHVTERKPCLLDALALGALRKTSTKLHKKAMIALTKWLVWSPAKAQWITKEVVRLQMFAADHAAEYRDTRIRHQGRLISWKEYSRLTQL